MYVYVLYMYNIVLRLVGAARLVLFLGTQTKAHRRYLDAKMIPRGVLGSIWANQHPMQKL